MDFNKLKTQELIEIYKQIEDFLSFLEKESQSVEKE